MRRQWISTDRYGVDHDIDPFDQVRRSKHALLEKIKSLPGWGNTWITLGHAVCFPQAVVAGADLPPDARPEIIIDGSNIAHLAARVRQVMQFWRSEEGTSEAGGNALVNELTRLIAPSTQLRHPLTVQIADEEREILRLTEEQFKVLGQLNRIRRAAISGCAGSGKTLLAVEKAKRLAHEGFETLLTCRNEPLARHLMLATAGVDRLTVRPFERMCVELIEAAGMVVPAQISDEVLADALSTAAAAAPDLRFDAIIIDEGQDFPDLWWIALEDCLRTGKESILYAFFDDNQRVYGSHGHIPTDLVPIILAENVRNTRAIHRYLRSYYAGQSGTTARGPSGREVEVFAYATADDLKRKLSKLLHRLVVGEGIETRDIVVLTPRPLDISDLHDATFASGFRLTDRFDVGPREVHCTSVRHFKGLERQVVIFAELDERMPEDPMERSATCYVALSRPRNHLILLGTAPVLAELQECAAEARQ
jgi:hypothetical protein